MWYMRCAAMRCAFLRLNCGWKSRQKLPAVDVDSALPLRSGDASEFDQTDRDLARALVVPSADAEGYIFDSNRNSVNRAAALSSDRERGVSQLRRALKPGSRPVNAVRLTASKIFAAPIHRWIFRCCDCFSGLAGQGEQRQYSKGTGQEPKAILRLECKRPDWQKRATETVALQSPAFNLIAS